MLLPFYLDRRQSCTLEEVVAKLGLPSNPDHTVDMFLYLKQLDSRVQGLDQPQGGSQKRRRLRVCEMMCIYITFRVMAMLTEG